MDTVSDSSKCCKRKKNSKGDREFVFISILCWVAMEDKFWPEYSVKLWSEWFIHYVQNRGTSVSEVTDKI